MNRCCLLILLMMVIGSSACRKTRTCECVTTNNSNGTQVTTITTFETSKRKANGYCSDLNKNEGDFTTACEVK